MDDGWNHNRHYAAFVERRMPSPCRQSLDVGCGPGWLTRRISERCDHAIGIDADQAVIAAIEPPAGGNPQFLLGDVMTYPLAPEGFDFVTAVAALHHLPLEPGLRRLRDLLRPGGVLVVVGLYRPATLADYAYSAFGHLYSLLLRARRATAEIGAPTRDPSETLAAIRAAAAALLPGAELKRRLLFRYTLSWTKPVGRLSLGDHWRPPAGRSISAAP